MTTRKLTSTDAFVVIDLDGAPTAAGIARLAPKVLVDGARWLARSQTYQFAAFGRPASGASAGINAPADGRGDAVAAFVGELEPDVASAAVLLEEGRGLSAADLAPLRGADPRPSQWWGSREQLRAVGAAAAAQLASGGSLDGRTVAVEGYDGSGAALVGALTERGARLVAVGTSGGSVADPAGLDPVAVSDAWDAHGPALVEQLGPEAGRPDGVLAADADVLLVGSKAGVVDHEAAGRVRARLVVPTGPVPVTAKALATLRRAETEVLPDFVTTGGHLAAWPADGGEVPSDPVAAAAELVEQALGGVLDHPSGALLGACEAAEAFLLTWRDELPFGRPLA